MRDALIKQGEQLTITVAQNEPKQRIDQFLHKQFPAYTRSFFQRAIEDQRVTCNGKTVTKAGYIIKALDQIELSFPVERSVTKEMVTGSDLHIEILYEHPHFIIINKPAGLLVHPVNNKNNEVTLADWIRYNFENISHVGYVDRPGIIHRLDKLTSGLMIIARTSYGFNQLGKLFRDRAIEKIYYAIVCGHPPKTGTITLPIGRDLVARNKMIAREITDKTRKARHAITHYEVEHYFENATLLRITLETGRTHQIRVHLAAIGFPILGDVVYGAKSPLINRQALHAQQLSFTFDDQHYLFKSSLPDDLKMCLVQLQTHSL